MLTAELLDAVYEAQSAALDEWMHEWAAGGYGDTNDGTFESQQAERRADAQRFVDQLNKRHFMVVRTDWVREVAREAR